MSTTDDQSIETDMQNLEMDLTSSNVDKLDTTTEAQISILEGIGSISRGLSNKKAMFLVFRSLVGVGILTMPHQINEIGIYGALIVFPMIGVLILYSLDLMVKTADDLKYYNQR